MSTVSQAEYARLRGVAKKTATIWKQKGFLILTADGGVDVEASDAKLAARPVQYRGGYARGPTQASPASEPPENGNGGPSAGGLRLGDSSVEAIAKATGWS